MIAFTDVLRRQAVGLVRRRRQRRQHQLHLWERVVVRRDKRGVKLVASIRVRIIHGRMLVRVEEVGVAPTMWELFVLRMAEWQEPVSKVMMAPE